MYIQKIQSPLLLLLVLVFFVSNDCLSQCKAKITTFQNKVSGCDPLTIIYSDSSLGNITGRKWNFGDNSPQSTSSNPSHTYKTGSKDTIYKAWLFIECLGGFKDSISVDITVSAKPLASFLSNKDSVCAISDSVCFTNKSATGPGITYQWNYGDFITSPSFENCHTYLNEGNYTVKLIVTNSITCLNESSKVITVNDAPNPEFDITNTFSGCVPLTVQFKNTTNTTLPGSSPIDTWIWSWGDTASNSFVKDPGGHTYYQPDTFKVTLTAINATGCKNNTSRALFVYPTPSLTLSTTDGDKIICEGDSIVFSTSPTTYNTYIFHDGFQILQSGTSSSFITSNLDTGNQIFATASMPFCDIPPTDTFTIDIRKKLQIPIVNCGNTSITSIEFVWDSIKDSKGYEISVNGNPFVQPSSGLMGLSHQINGLNPNDSITILVHSLGAPPCGNSNDSPPLTCKAIQCNGIAFKQSSNPIICKGEKAEMNIYDISTPTNFYQISWNNSVFGLDSTLSVTPTKDTTVTVRLKDPLQPGCPSLLKSFSIKVNPIPTVTLTSMALTDTFCRGDTITFTSQPPGYDFYTFYTGNLIVQSSSNPVFKGSSISNSDLIKVSVSNLGCVKESNVIKVSLIDSLPSPQIFCGSSTTSFVEFLWDKVDDAKGYMVSVNGGNYIVPSSGTNGLNHIVSGVNASVNLKVRASGDEPCGDSYPSREITCLAVNCGLTNFATSPDTAICKGDSILLFINKIQTPSGKYFISWNGKMITKDSTFLFTDTISGIVRVVVTDSVQSNCPIIEKTIRVNIKNLPVINLTSSISNDSICEGEQVFFTATPGFTDYKFYEEFSLIKSGPSNIYSTDTLKNNKNIKVIVTKSGCSGESNAINKKIVQPLSTPVINCGSSNISLISVYWDPIPGATGYLVSVNNSTFVSPSSGTMGLSHVVTNLQPNELVSVKVKATGKQPCGDSQISNISTCTATSCGAVSFKTSPDLKICKNADQVNVSISALQTPSGNFQIKWNNTALSTDTLFGFFATQDTTKISVAVTDPAQPTCPSVTKYINVIMKNIPVLTLTDNLPNDSTCENLPMSISVNPPGLDRYTFTLGTMVLQDTTNNQYSGVFPVGNNILKVQTEYNACLSNANYTFTVIANPLIVLTSTDTDTLICSGDIVKFTVSPSVFDTYIFKNNNSVVKNSSSDFYFTDSLKQGNKITVETSNKKLCNRKSKSISTQVKPLPVVTLSSSAINDSICSGQNVVFKAIPSGYDIYEFYDRNVILQKNNDSLFSTSNLTSGNSIKIRAENSGCVGKITDSLSIIIKPTPVVSITGDSTICTGSATLLNASGSSKIDWSNGSSTTSILVNPLLTTIYSAKATTNGCTSKTDSFKVYVDTDPVEADAGTNKMICINENTTLQASGGASYRWSPTVGLTDTLSATPSVNPTVTTTYKVRISNIYCTGFDSVIITVDRCLETIPPTVIPQVISPNNDGINDTWIIPNIDYFTKNKVILFNRWGSQINTYDYYLNTWEGKNSQGQDLPDGTYYYIIDLGNGSKKITGFIMVHR